MHHTSVAYLVLTASVQYRNYKPLRTLRIVLVEAYWTFLLRLLIYSVRNWNLLQVIGRHYAVVHLQKAAEHEDLVSVLLRLQYGVHVLPLSNYAVLFLESSKYTVCSSFRQYGCYYLTGPHHYSTLLSVYWNGGRQSLLFEIIHVVVLPD